MNREQLAVVLSHGFAAVLTFGFTVFFICGCVYEYNNGIPQRQYELKKQRIADAEKELQEWLIAHPEFKEVHE